VHRVESGIIWDKIQEAINPLGLALKAMQSDNIFTVAGSLAANAHGRDAIPTIVKACWASGSCWRTGR